MVHIGDTRSVLQLVCEGFQIPDIEGCSQQNVDHDPLRICLTNGDLKIHNSYELLNEELWCVLTILQYSVSNKKLHDSLLGCYRNKTIENFWQSISKPFSKADDL